MSRKTKVVAANAAFPTIPKDWIDQLLAGAMSGEAVNADCMAFKKALIERALDAELLRVLFSAGWGERCSGSGRRLWRDRVSRG